MLMDKINIIKEQIDKKEDFIKQQHESKRNQNLLARLNGIERTLDKVISNEKVLVSFELDDHSELVNKFFYNLSKLRRMNSPLDRLEFIATITADITTIENSQKLSWNEKVKNDFDPIISVGQMLDKVLNKHQFNLVPGKMKIYLDAIPENPDREEQYIQDVKTSQRELKNYKLNEQIERFLEKLAVGEASYTDINEDILGWLNEHNLTGRIKVRLV